MSNRNTHLSLVASADPALPVGLLRVRNGDMPNGTPVLGKDGQPLRFAKKAPAMRKMISLFKGIAPNEGFTPYNVLTGEIL